MLLYIVRHAWAFERDSTRWPDDALRPLTDEGRKRFSKMMNRLAGAKFSPEIIATSPYVRCQETAHLIAERLANAPKIEPHDALAPGSDLPAIVRWSQGQPATSIAWVGHAPDVEHMVAELIGDSSAMVRFAKGAVAAIEFDGAIEPGEGELQWLATAKLLGV
jgi:phosphohistidine phosphatase